MAFSNLFQRLFNTVSPPDDDDDMDGEAPPFELGQNIRMALALVVVIVAACVTWWIMV
ncbi:MAG: hypothetical protein IJD16_02390 [Desulfovibrio sp.]|nr:hypothetical protein [Desulfovibrio sp.]